MRVVISRWFFFTVIPALLPIMWLASRLRSRHLSFSLEGLLGRGEALLACSAFAAAGIGDLIGSGKQNRVGKNIVAGCCLLVLCNAINDYADIGMALEQHQGYDFHWIAMKSVWMCLFGILCGGYCIKLAGYK